MPSFSQWQQLWQRLGATPDKVPDKLYYELIARYNEVPRYYHTLQHLNECLEKFELLRTFAKFPAEIEIALWFHDAIYEPSRHDNEELSADWAKSSILSACLDKVIAERIYNLVMSTQHQANPTSVDEQILVDVDLAILGAKPDRFEEYEQQVRQEYAFVPKTLFRAKRKEILMQFQARATIYNTNQFIEIYEQQARINIRQALEKL